MVSVNHPEAKRSTTVYQERIVHFANKEVKRVLGDDMELVMHNKLFSAFDEKSDLGQSSPKKGLPREAALMSLAEIVSESWMGKRLYFIKVSETEV